MENERMLGVEEMAAIVGVTSQTVKSWYKFRKENPDNPYARMLPETERGLRNKILFHETDKEALLEFKRNKPKGRYGVMGDVTQKYVPARKDERERDYIDKVIDILEKKEVFQETIDAVRKLLEDEATIRLGKAPQKHTHLSRKEEFMYELTDGYGNVPEDFDSWFDACLNLMKPRYRTVLEAYYKEGKTFQEIGDGLGVSRQCVHAMKKAFINRLRKMMCY